VGLEASIQTKEKEAFFLLFGFCPLHYVRFSVQFQFVHKEMGTSLLVGVGLLQLVKLGFKFQQGSAIALLLGFIFPRCGLCAYHYTFCSLNCTLI
jgi:hypothetical protein